MASRSSSVRHISPQLADNYDLLVYLNQLSKRQRNQLLSQLKREHLDCLCALAVNYLKGNLPVPPTKARKLHRLRELIQALCHKTLSLSKKKAILISQKGGFILGALIPAAISLIGSLVGNAIRT